MTFFCHFGSRNAAEFSSRMQTIRPRGKTRRKDKNTKKKMAVQKLEIKFRCERTEMIDYAEEL